MANISHGQPDTQNEEAIIDEAFLLFLADSVENDTELLDPLSMIEVQSTQTNTPNETHTDIKEANDE